MKNILNRSFYVIIHSYTFDLTQIFQFLNKFLISLILTTSRVCQKRRNIQLSTVEGLMVLTVNLWAMRSSGEFARLFNSSELFSFDLRSSFMIIREVASLTHSHGIQKSIIVSTFRCVLISSELPVAGWTHVLCIVLSVHVRTFCN
jgi:hypothetical protein